jgi:hypothetical protein
VEIYYKTFKYKDRGIPWRCRSCNDKYRNKLYENKSPEEKSKFVAQQVARTKRYWKNLSEEEKVADSNRRKNLWKKRLDSNDLHIFHSMVKGRAEWYNSLSDEEKQSRYQLRNDARDKWWNSLSDEQKTIHMDHPHNGFREWYNNLSEEDKKSFMKPIWDGCKKFWSSLTPEMYQNWYIKQNTEYNKYVNNINKDPNRNELSLISFFNEYNIPYTYQYFNTIRHPKFDELFHINPVTGSDLINPYHQWDFIIHTKQKNVLIDIDGSVHSLVPGQFVTKTGFDVGTYVRFNDSQRPYQTDGLDAYIVQCYDDKLNDNTPVLSLQSNEVMTLKQLLSILEWLNKSNEEQKLELTILE